MWSERHSSKSSDNVLRSILQHIKPLLKAISSHLSNYDFEVQISVNGCFNVEFISGDTYYVFFLFSFLFPCCLPMDGCCFLNVEPVIKNSKWHKIKRSHSRRVCFIRCWACSEWKTFFFSRFISPVKTTDGKKNLVNLICIIYRFGDFWFS